MNDEVWRFFATPFVHDSLGYQFAALLGVGIFGTLLERRFGPAPVVVIFVLSGAAGAALAVTLDVPPLLDDRVIYPVLGANGAALGLLFAWLVDDRLAARRGDERGNDLIGVYVVAAVLVLLSFAVIEANVAAARAVPLTGAVLGLALPLFTRKSALLVSRRCSRTSRWRRAVRALSEPERFAGAERRVSAIAPQLQQILAARAQRGRLVRRGARVAAAPGARRGRPSEQAARIHAARRGDPDGHADRRGGRLGARP